LRIGSYLLAEANISAQEGFECRLIILNSPLSILNLASNLLSATNIENFCGFVKVCYYPRIEWPHNFLFSFYASYAQNRSQKEKKA
jgi:hypothetical protein